MEDRKITISVEGAERTGKNAIIAIIAEALKAKGLGGLVTRVEDTPGDLDVEAVKAKSIEIVEVPTFFAIKETRLGKAFDQPLLSGFSPKQELVPEVIGASLYFQETGSSFKHKIENVCIHASDKLRTILFIEQAEITVASHAGPSTRIQLTVDHKTGVVEQSLGENCTVRLSDNWVLELLVMYKIVLKTR